MPWVAKIASDSEARVLGTLASSEVRFWQIFCVSGFVFYRDSSHVAIRILSDRTGECIIRARIYL